MAIVPIQNRTHLWRTLDSSTAKRVTYTLFAGGLLFVCSSFAPSIVRQLKHIKAKPGFAEKCALCTSTALLCSGMISLALTRIAPLGLSRCRADQLVDIAKRPCTHPNVRPAAPEEKKETLNADPTATDAELLALPQDLERIDLSECPNITEHGLVAFLHQYPRLKEIRLRGFRPISGHLIAALVNHKALEVIDLSECPPIDVEPKLLRVLLFGLPRLRTLLLPDLAGASELLECHAEFCRAEKLQTLHIGRMVKQEESQVFLQDHHKHLIPFDRLPALRALHLHCTLDPIYLSILLNHCPQLEELSIPSDMLWRSYAPSCRLIELRDLVQDAKPLRRLTILPGTVDCAPGDQFSQLLEKVPDLEELSVFGLIGGDLSLSKRLTDHCPNLHRLVVEGNNCFGLPEEIRAFEEKHPHLEKLDVILSDEFSDSDSSC